MALEAGFDLVGIARAERVDASRLDRWLDCGHHADMEWMRRGREARLDPCVLVPSARSVVSLAVNYFHPGSTKILGGGRLSRHAWGRDYHKVLGGRLRALRRSLLQEVPDMECFGGVDGVPIMEKLWAERSGLGWIGKSGNLITRRFGSWVFLATLILDVEMEPDEPATDHCGSCRRCIDACPTGAVVSFRTVDAKKCLSFNTIENRTQWPASIADRSGGWIYGCDVCQEACPWSQRFARVSSEKDFAPREGLMSLSVADLAGLSEIDFDGLTRGSSLRRAGLKRIRANAGVARRIARGEGG